MKLFIWRATDEFSSHIKFIIYKKQLPSFDKFFAETRNLGQYMIRLLSRLNILIICDSVCKTKFLMTLPARMLKIINNMRTSHFKINRAQLWDYKDVN